MKISPCSEELCFASPERDGEKEILRSVRSLEVLPFFHTFMDSFPGMVTVLNQSRQIVFANRALLDALGKKKEEILGLRPGEAFRCVHAWDTPGGCGTSRFCRTCGAVWTILKSLGGEAWSEECRILREEGGRPTPLNLRVWGKPFRWEGRAYTIFSIQDISQEVHKKNLERLFFHDLLNLASGIQSWASILAEGRLDEEEAREVGRNLQEASEELVREIQAQKTLTLAEGGKLVPRVEEIHPRDLLARVKAQVAKMEVAKGKTLRLEPGEEDLRLFSDFSLLRRILLNLARNALEAASPGESVTLGVRREEKGVCFWVHNPGVIPQDVQLQLFQRYFSTKGPGRGLGTYSVKLFTERYLGGEASFRSAPGEGTTFLVRLPWKTPPAGGRDAPVARAGEGK